MGILGFSASSMPLYILYRLRRKDLGCGQQRICGSKRFPTFTRADIAYYYTILCFTFRDTFVYEYVGDVVNQPSFLKRMRQYAEEGIRHFYFMMLQKDEVLTHGPVETPDLC